MLVQLTQLGLHFIHYDYLLNIIKQCLDDHICFMREDRDTQVIPGQGNEFVRATTKCKHMLYEANYLESDF